MANCLCFVGLLFVIYCFIFMICVRFGFVCCLGVLVGLVVCLCWFLRLICVRSVTVVWVLVALDALFLLLGFCLLVVYCSFG